MENEEKYKQLKKGTLFYICEYCVSLVILKRKRFGSRGIK